VKKLISVCGPAHSGTTLLATMIGSHPNIHLIPKETYWFSEEWWAYGDIRGAYDYLNSSIKQEYVLEKTPAHVRYVGKILENFPDSKIIVSLRDPRDIVWSMYKRHQDWSFSVDQTMIDFMEAEKLKTNKNVKIIRYEDVVNDTRQTVTEISEHVGVNFNDRMINHHKFSPTWFENVGGDHEKHRALQVKKPLYDGSNQYIGNLDKNQLNQIKNKIEKFSENFGYRITV